MIPGLEKRDYGRGDPLRWPRDTLYQLKLALTSSAGCGRSLGIVRLRTKTTEFSFSQYDFKDQYFYINPELIKMFQYYSKFSQCCVIDIAYYMTYFFTR
jgi:actin-related protein